MKLTKEQTLAAKRLAFPLRAPRQLTLAWWPLHAFAAAVDAYHLAFFACMAPGRGE